jgi:hypothetical protein
MAPGPLPWARTAQRAPRCTPPPSPLPPACPLPRWCALSVFKPLAVAAPSPSVPPMHAGAELDRHLRGLIRKDAGARPLCDHQL